MVWYYGFSENPEQRIFDLGQSRGVCNEREILESLPIPVAILHGMGDPVVNRQYLENLNIRNLWTRKVITKDRCRHYPHLEHPDWFNQQLLGFLRKVDQ